MDNNTTNQLKQLFDLADPASLRGSLNQVFFNFLWHNHKTLPANFDKVSEDFYFLIDFLEKVDRQSETNSA